jgi:glucosamine--fructose-6-phosphate aminotransferase (isomerizing)
MTTGYEMGMASELREAPDAVRGQTDRIAAPVMDLAMRLKRRPPAVVVTCARGSSAHAATFAKHLIELHLGIPVAAAAPNIASVYRRPLRLDGQFFLAVSQSGRSDDLVANALLAREAGALTAALVNDTESPLAAACEIVLPMCAGPERSVAATKTFVASLAALLRVVAAWAEDRSMSEAIERLPQRLALAAELDWSAALDAIAAAPSLIAIGRGPTLAIAREAALKLKEIANRHAEAFSGAEFLHGPVALVGSRYPILAFMPTDAAAEGMRALASDLGRKGAALFATAPDGALPVPAPDHPATDAVCLVQSFYAMMVRLAAGLGIDPDRPRHLQKVTRTR